jgi:Mg-chelatase subunit ChlD
MKSVSALRKLIIYVVDSGFSMTMDFRMRRRSGSGLPFTTTPLLGWLQF